MKKLVLFSLLLTFLWGCKQKPKKNVQEKVSKENTIDFSQYTFNTPNGKNQKVDLKKGKLYLLDFWFIECPPCVRDHKKIQQNRTKLTEQNVEVIGFSIDRNVKDWKTYLSKHNYNWQQYNQYFQEPSLRKDLKIKMYPRYFLVDDKGIIKKQTGSLAKMLRYLKIK